MWIFFYSFVKILARLNSKNMFKSSLEQERIFEEIKNGTGNILINALAGTGKCLGKGTKVLMYDGYFKNVEDIISGDILMGDDGTPRTVLNTNIGYDKLYKVEIISSKESFICNEDHILTCNPTVTPNEKYKSFLKVDISIKDIINNKENYDLSISNRVRGYLLYRSILDYTGSKINNFYEYGYNFFDNTDVKFEDMLTTIENRYLILSGIIDRYFYPLKNILVLEKEYTDNKNIWILKKVIRGLGFKLLTKFNQYYIHSGNFGKLTLNEEKFEYYFSKIKHLNKNSNNTSYKDYFTIDLLPEKGDYYGFTLDGNGRFIIEDYIVTHNTTTIVKSLEHIPEDKRVLMLAFNKHIANELKERLPKRDNLWISTTHALGWGALRKKYKNAVIDDNKSYRVINSKMSRWNLSEVDNIEEYSTMIKKMVDLCRVTLTLERRFVVNLANNHGFKITDEDARRILSVIEEMYNDVNTFDFIDMIYVPAIDKKIWMFPNDYVFVDECVFGGNNIITSMGPISFKSLFTRFVKNKKSWMSQQDIPKALSYNMVTDEYEYKNITNIEFKGTRKVSRINFKNFTIYSTDSHLFYTSEGWREAKDLSVGDAVKANSNSIKTCYLPNNDQVDLLFVMCLNDYSFTKQLNTAKFRFYIDNKNVPYFNFITRLIEYSVKSNINGYYTEYITASYYLNSRLDKEFIISRLTNKQLAMLFARLNYIDDNYIGFGFNAKTYDEALYYKGLFEKSLNIKFDIKTYRKGYYYVVNDIEGFISRIGKFLTEDYKDIIPEKYHNYIGGYEYKSSENKEPYMIVREITHNFRKRRVYDITVEDNHNYFIMGTSNFEKLGSIHWRKKRNNVGILSHNCQDYNRAQQFILNKVIKKDTGRLVSVGDNHQCQPAGTKVLLYNGIEKNIEDIVVGDMVVTYNRKDCGCFRGYFQKKKKKINGYKILETSKRFINEELIVIESGGNKSKYTFNHKCFVRFNPNKTNAHALYLMEKDGYFRIGITPLWSKNKLASLTHRAKGEKVDKFWVLNVYDSKVDCYFDEQYYSLLYGIPQMIFTYKRNGNHKQDTIDKFYNRFDKDILFKSAQNLLNNFNRKYEYPLWSKDDFNYFSKNHLFKIVACNIIPEYMEMIHFDKNNLNERKHGKNGSISVIKPKYKKIDNLSYENFNGYVYSLKVEKYESYVADGMLTHNSIYYFNGSDSNAFNWFGNKENTTTLPLTTSYRCSKSVIRHAQNLVPNINYKADAVEGSVRNGSVLTEANSGDFVLSRTNKPLVVLLFDLLRMGKNASINGNDIGITISKTISKYKTIQQLDSGLTNLLTEKMTQLVNMGVMDVFNDPRYVNLRDNIDIIRFLMGNSKTIKDILDKLPYIFTDNPTGIILSTVHKSKGLEADNVFIIKPDKLKIPTKIPEMWEQEINLEYIAYTRAKVNLIIDNDWTDEER